MPYATYGNHHQPKILAVELLKFVSSHPMEPMARHSHVACWHCQHWLIISCTSFAIRDQCRKKLHEPSWKHSIAHRIRMYAIYAHIYHQYTPVMLAYVYIWLYIYTIHGSYGYCMFGGCTLVDWSLDREMPVAETNIDMEVSINGDIQKCMVYHGKRHKKRKIGGVPLFQETFICSWL